MEEGAIIREGFIRADDIVCVRAHLEDVFSNTVKKVAVVGHSLGGSAGIEATFCFADIVAFANRDGRQLRKELACTKPILLLVAHQEKKGREQFEASFAGVAHTHIDVEAKHGTITEHPDTVPQLLAFLGEHL